MAKLTIFILFFTFAMNSYARVYFAGSVSTVKQIDDSDSAGSTQDLFLEGTGYSAYLGYRFSFLAIEGVYKSLETNAKSGNSQFELSDRITGLGLRVFVFKFVNIKFGTMKHDASGDITTSGVKVSDYESTSNGNYSGLGLRVPVGMWDFFVDFTQYSSEDDIQEDSGILFHDYEFGIRFYI